MYEQKRKYLVKSQKEKPSRTGSISVNDNEVQRDSRTNFEKNKLIDYYRKMRESQHAILGTINMSEDLKKKLFGFSEGYYVQNQADPSQLVVEDHPIRGRIIMTREKYENYLLAKHKERQTRIHESSHNSVSKVKSDSDEGEGSSLQKKQKQVVRPVQEESHNDFGKLKLQSVYQQPQQ